MNIPTFSQRFLVPDLPTTDELLPYLRQIDQNKWYSNFGPLAVAFETRFAQTMAAAHGSSKIPSCIGVGSGYQALTVGMRLMGIGPGSKVLVPSVTFPACPLAVENLGAEALLADVDPVKWTLTPEIARAAAEKNQIDAVMPVCVYGFPLDPEPWDAFTRETGISVIIDAAAAVESQRYLETGYVAHSMHALKPFGIGEGGILVTPHPDIAEKVRQRINFGMQNRVSYQSGENAKMSEYHAAVALAQLDRWEGIKARRWQAYQSFLDELPAIEHILTVHPDHAKTVPSTLMATLKKPEAAQLLDKLVARGIPAHRTYLPPLYTHPYFAGMGVVDASGHLQKSQDLAPKSAMMHGAEHMNSSVIGLPFHAFLTDEEIHHIVTMIGECAEQLVGTKCA